VLDYRVFVVGEDGHVLDRYEFWCATEEEAKERARQLLDGRDVELWHRDQRIAIFNHKRIRPLQLSGSDYLPCVPYTRAIA
jgi:hypothetical protein